MNETLNIGYIYELVCSETGNIYYGSTCKPHTRYLHHRENIINVCRDI